MGVALRPASRDSGLSANAELKAVKLVRNLSPIHPNSINRFLGQVSYRERPEAVT